MHACMHTYIHIIDMFYSGPAQFQCTAARRDAFMREHTVPDSHHQTAAIRRRGLVWERRHDLNNNMLKCLGKGYEVGVHDF
jgi:hypothetical protein